MRPLPSQVQVGPIAYSVEASRPKLEALRSKDLRSYAAYCLHRDAAIVLDEDLDGDVAVECLVHEVLHAMLEVYSLHEVSTDEQFVCQFTPVLIDTLRRNPLLVAAVLGLEIQSERRVLR